MYINIETQEVITRAQLEQAHQDPLVAFPLEVCDEVLEEFGYANVGTMPQPESQPGLFIVRGPVVKTEDGYFFSWETKPVVIHPEEVDAERDRRTDLGIPFEDSTYQSRASDRENITGAAQLAMFAIFGGAKKGDYRWSDPEQDFEWINASNELVKLDAYQVVELGKTAANRKQALIFAARNLKDMDPIPFDFADDKYWS